VEQLAGQMQQAGLANELGRQLVETVGESLERNPRLTVQQFREGGNPARLARMRQWDRATGEPETTDRIVDGLIDLGSPGQATVYEIPRPPASSPAPSVPSTTPDTAAPTAQPAGTSASSSSPAAEQYDPGLFERLRTWRLETAQQTGQKAFYVFPDATLQRIAAAQPQTLEDLQAVKGVGPKKLQQYGDAVLDVTRQEAAPPAPEGGGAQQPAKEQET
jgi:superfamily II DNA helicase RecQ